MLAVSLLKLSSPLFKTYYLDEVVLSTNFVKPQIKAILVLIEKRHAVFLCLAVILENKMTSNSLMTDTNSVIYNTHTYTRWQEMTHKHMVL